jgi:hypothetical protein
MPSTDKKASLRLITRLAHERERNRCRANARDWGFSVLFHIRDGNEVEARRRARLAARWAIRSLNH